MADLPDAAVQAAADAISRLLFSGQPEYGTWLEHDEALALAALEAAAPLIAAQVRREAAEQIAAAIEALCPDTDTDTERAGDHCPYREAADTARQIGGAT